MEKYELNKLIDEYKVKIADLNTALAISLKQPLYRKLEEEMNDPFFWQDQEKAQKVIAKANALKEVLTAYTKLENRFQDFLSLAEMALEDEEAMLLLDEEAKLLQQETDLLEEKALLSQKYDDADCILELHPGAGGTESMDWADMLFRMYQRFASRKGFRFNILDYQAGEEAGIKSVTVQIQGENAYGLFKSERGVHRLVRISPFDSNARRHTSFVSVDVAPQMDEAEDVVIKEEDLKVDVYHSSGAGGQSVNTTDSAVRITHKPSGIVVTCQNERSQIKNREVALKVLKSKLLELEIQKKEEEMRTLKGTQMGINFGSQIRSYVFCPYTLVKDHRTNYEMGNINAVMDGDIEGFMIAYLKQVCSFNRKLFNKIEQ